MKLFSVGDLYRLIRGCILSPYFILFYTMLLSLVHARLYLDPVSIHTRWSLPSEPSILNTDRHYLTESNKVVLPISPSCEHAHEQLSADSLVAYRSYDRCSAASFRSRDEDKIGDPKGIIIVISLELSALVRTMRKPAQVETSGRWMQNSRTWSPWILNGSCAGATISSVHKERAIIVQRLRMLPDARTNPLIAPHGRRPKKRIRKYVGTKGPEGSTCSLAERFLFTTGGGNRAAVRSDGGRGGRGAEDKRWKDKQMDKCECVQERN